MWVGRAVVTYCLPKTSVVRIGRNAPCVPITPHEPMITATRHCIEICEGSTRSVADQQKVAWGVVH